MEPLQNATKWGDRESPYIKVTDSLKKFVFDHLRMDPHTNLKKYPKMKSLEDILADSQLPSGFKLELTKSLGEDKISDDPWARIKNSLGQNYIELLRSRFIDINAIVDLVVYPKSHEDVVKTVRVANKYKVPLSSVGGATSVTLGIEPISGIVALNLKNMNNVLYVNKSAQYIIVQTGILGPKLESLLNHENLTLGHFPQSFEYSSLGGWVATRGAGQSSTLYGKIEEMVMGLKFVTGTGETLSIKKAPARATGPDLNQIIAGS